MAFIPFIPGQLSGALIGKLNCDTEVGAVGCIPPAPVGNTDWVGFCSKSDLEVAVTVEVDEISAINSCVRLPAEREVTGAVATITGCRQQDAALLQLIGAADPVVWDDPDNTPPTPIVAEDNIGYKMRDFGSTGCQTCGSGCDYFHAVFWLCATPIQGCVTALPRGVYAVLLMPSFKFTQPREMAFGGARADIEDKLNFEIDMFDLGPNEKYYPCTDPDVAVPNRGAIFDVGGDELMPDVLGLEGSPLAVFLTNVAPPVSCDCCGDAGFWTGPTDGTDPGTGSAPIALFGEAAAAYDAEVAAAKLAELAESFNDPEVRAEMDAVAAQLHADAASTTPAKREHDLKARVAAERAKS